MKSITPTALAALFASQAPLTVLDVRRLAAKNQDPRHIPGAVWHDPAAWLEWKDHIARDKSVVVYCAKGHEISQAMTACLAALGAEACYLEGGIAAWHAAGVGVNLSRS